MVGKAERMEAWGWVERGSVRLHRRMKAKCRFEEKPGWSCSEFGIGSL